MNVNLMSKRSLSTNLIGVPSRINPPEKLIFAFMLGVLQGFVGWFMVKSGLIDNPKVSHYRLAVHLFIAFFILTYIYNIKLSLTDKIKKKIQNYNYFNTNIRYWLCCCTYYIFIY